MPSEHVNNQQELQGQVAPFRVEADPAKIIALLRNENEQLRHEHRILAIAYGEAQELAASMRSEIDALALQIASAEEGSKKKTASTNGSKK